MKRSKWIQTFSIVPAYQAKWSELGGELIQPLNSMTIDQLVDATILLMRAMGYRCTTQPNKLMRTDFKIRSVGLELMKWRRKLKDAFGMQGSVTNQISLARQDQVDKILEE